MPKHVRSLGQTPENQVCLPAPTKPGSREAETTPARRTVGGQGSLPEQLLLLQLPHPAAAQDPTGAQGSALERHLNPNPRRTPPAALPPPRALLTAAPCPPPAAPSCSSVQPWGSARGRAVRRAGCTDPRPWSGGAGRRGARLGAPRPLAALPGRSAPNGQRGAAAPPGPPRSASSRATAPGRARSRVRGAAPPTVVRLPRGFPYAQTEHPPAHTCPAGSCAHGSAMGLCNRTGTGSVRHSPEQIVPRAPLILER